mmetsp:Transcript_15704/g.44441  ORF Transcript_15704/g.44441 Transcript_15704/m.44441 type:complete len:263 (+) Transcript_15704:852-1640(+)
MCVERVRRSCVSSDGQDHFVISQESLGLDHRVRARRSKLNCHVLDIERKTVAVRFRVLKCDTHLDLVVHAQQCLVVCIRALGFQREGVIRVDDCLVRTLCRTDKCIASRCALARRVSGSGKGDRVPSVHFASSAHRFETPHIISFDFVCTAWDDRLLNHHLSATHSVATCTSRDPQGEGTEVVELASSSGRFQELAAWKHHLEANFVRGSLTGQRRGELGHGRNRASDPGDAFKILTIRLCRDKAADVALGLEVIHKGSIRA